MQHIVITGSSRGIGFGLATQFLKLNYKVTITGTQEENLKKAIKELSLSFSKDQFQGIICDVTQTESIENLWKKGIEKFEKIDIWINNAGIGQPKDLFHNLSEEMIQKLIHTNLLSVMNATKIVYNLMIKQGFGQIYNMEGFGSGGRKMPKMTLYGSSKNALTYFTESFILETKNSPIQICTISPGMVLTNMLLEPIRNNPEKNKKTITIFNILADEVETVTKYLTQKIHLNQKHGVKIKWLTGRKMFWRFLKSIFIKRAIVEKYLESK